MKTYAGSCHCKAVRFEVEIEDIAQVARCNCTLCTKLGAVGCIVKPAAFRLLTADDGAGSYAGKVGHMRFCKTCGIYCFSRGYLPEVGGDYVSVNVNCLDEVDVGLLEPMHWDGRHDNWDAGPRKTHWPVFA